jgi:hypothetical protein
MSLEQATTLMARMERHINSPAAAIPPTVAKFLGNWLVPVLKEMLEAGLQSEANLAEAMALSQMAFSASRETLAGQMFEEVANVSIELREALSALNLPESEALMGLLDRLDRVVEVYEDVLAQEDEEEDEGEEPTALAAVEPAVAVIESEPAAEPTEPAVESEPAAEPTEPAAP